MASIANGAAQPDKRMAFAAESPWEARSAASDWLGNFAEHGPLDIRSIRVIPDRDRFVAIVIYAEMKVEAAPRHFDKEAPLLKSA